MDEKRKENSMIISSAHSSCGIACKAHYTAYSQERRTS
jgi:hypothetical protein